MTIATEIPTFGAAIDVICTKNGRNCSARFPYFDESGQPTGGGLATNRQCRPEPCRVVLVGLGNPSTGAIPRVRPV